MFLFLFFFYFFLHYLVEALRRRYWRQISRSFGRDLFVSETSYRRDNLAHKLAGNLFPRTPVHETLRFVLVLQSGGFSNFAASDAQLRAVYSFLPFGYSDSNVCRAI